MISQFQTVINPPPPPSPSTTPNRSEQTIGKLTIFILFSTAVLDSCSCPEFGKQLQAHLLKNGFHGREFTGTKLFQMYGRCGCVADVLQVFDKMPERNLYTYTAILNVLLDKGMFEEALLHYERILLEDVELDFFIFPAAFKICVGYGGFEVGRQLQAIATKAGVGLTND